MIDLVCAMFGRCGWCEDKDANWFERFIGADGYYGDMPTWGRFVWYFYDRLGHRLGIWKLAEKWHYMYHEKVCYT